MSMAKELIPAPEESLAMLMNELDNRIQFYSAEASGVLKDNWLQPKFRDHILASDVNMRRLAPVQGHKEKAVGTYSENCWHSIAILSNS